MHVMCSIQVGPQTVGIHPVVTKAKYCRFWCFLSLFDCSKILVDNDQTITLKLISKNSSSILFLRKHELLTSRLPLWEDWSERDLLSLSFYLTEKSANCFQVEWNHKRHKTLLPCLFLLSNPAVIQSLSCPHCLTLKQWGVFLICGY